MEKKHQSRRVAAQQYISSGDTSMLPIFTPEHNLREICKQSLLLEDHLSHPGKRCPDCICKHLLTMEALAEEAVTLFKSDEGLPLLHSLADFIREAFKDLAAGESETEIARLFREMRKILMPFLTDFPSSKRIAHAHLIRCPH